MRSVVARAWGQRRGATQLAALPGKEHQVSVSHLWRVPAAPEALATRSASSRFLRKRSGRRMQLAGLSSPQKRLSVRGSRRVSRPPFVPRSPFFCCRKRAKPRALRNLGWSLRESGGRNLKTAPFSLRPGIDEVITDGRRKGAQDCAPVQLSAVALGRFNHELTTTWSGPGPAHRTRAVAELSLPSYQYFGMATAVREHPPL